MPTMPFSDLYKSPKSPLAKLRHAHHLPPDDISSQSPDYHVDLVSRDKARQKEAVKRYLADKVRDDWNFVWPPAGTNGHDATAQKATAPANKAAEQGSSSSDSMKITPAPPLPGEEGQARDLGGDADSETGSVYSTVSEDPQHYRPRQEWTSDLSDDDEPAATGSPFRFDNPESVGAAVQTSAMARKARRRREERAEMAHNEGLACFSARRDAWTGARTVHVKPKPAPPPSPTSKRRSLWRFNSHTKHEQPAPAAQGSTGAQASATSPISPVTSNSRHSQQSVRDTTTPLTSDGDDSRKSKEGNAPPAVSYPVETLLPIPPPLLPPENPMRASISPNIYVSLYDKVIVHSLQPSCPINLSDMLKSCVAGWKRDGEWPRRSVELTNAAAAAARKKKKEEQRAAANKERRGSNAGTGVTRTISGAGGSGSGGRRLSLTGLLGRVSGEKGAEEKDKDKVKAPDKSGEAAPADHDPGAPRNIRRSIQRALGLGHNHGASVGSVEG
ncbi:uncharacterized protein E0L32_010950 [Thyridium curvatum]|uniref:Gag1-like clamp domain-containing protein n=1 Tax=Thyridium curvatum TaxID=1093900 RepID=A0A507AQK0_9PEZI|nr:uncharacterized protein E0L32_010950 [Thyridium curvatum]TPX07149.1 hypothetical protein E0L32_010950 [Thyridium curvatum]